MARMAKWRFKKQRRRIVPNPHAIFVPMEKPCELKLEGYREDRIQTLIEAIERLEQQVGLSEA